MIKNLLVIVGLVAACVNVGVGQCTPDGSITTPGFYPKTIPNATVGTAYNQVMQIRVPKDTLIGPIPASVKWLYIDEIQGLPQGFTYDCNTDSCKFAGNSNGCLVISGTPIAGDDNKKFDLIVKYKLVGTVFGSDAEYPAENKDYSFCVGTCPVGIDELNPNSFGMLQNVPNPFQGTTVIKFSSPTNQEIEFGVYDLLGREVYRETISAIAGINQIEYTPQGGTGVFLYTISDGRTGFTKRMVVSNDISIR